MTFLFHVEQHGQTTHEIRAHSAVQAARQYLRQMGHSQLLVWDRFPPMKGLDPNNPDTRFEPIDTPGLKVYLPNVKSNRDAGVPERFLVGMPELTPGKGTRVERIRQPNTKPPKQQPPMSGEPLRIIAKPNVPPPTEPPVVALPPIIVGEPMLVVIPDE